MSDFLGPLLNEPAEISSTLRKRGTPTKKKTIRARTKKLLHQKLAIEEEEGWRLSKTNPKSLTVEQDKPVDVALEDELWSIVGRLGFPEASDGRQFKIKVGPDVNPRQIDVFAKDDETALCIECTTSEIHKPKNMSSLIEKISAIRKNISDSINSHYGTNPRLKVRWVIATRNIEWGTADLKKAEAEKIVVLRDHELDYFTKLSKVYKGALRYQFLAHVFSGERIKALDIQVSATRGRMGGHTFYNFLISPQQLIKIAFVSHKASKSIEAVTTYQRLLAPRRLKNIAAYVDANGQFPTNIVINIKNGKSPLNFDKKEKIGESAFGILHLPNTYASAWIIDGQHRLYGYAQSERASIPTDKTMLPVLAYENLSPKEEAQLFIDINCQQVRVRKNLLAEIFSNLGWDSSNIEERIEALRSRTAMALDQRVASPIYGRVQTTGREKSNFRCLTLTSLCDGMKENRFFGEKHKGHYSVGPFIDATDEEVESDLNKAYAVISNFLELFKATVPAQWQKGDLKGGYVCTNNALRSLLRVLRDILEYIRFKHHIDLETAKPDIINGHVSTYIQPLLDFFREAQAEEIQIFRSRQALTGVRKNALTFESFINKTFQDFMPAGLKEYLDTVDIDGTKDAQQLIDEIQAILFDGTIELLKGQFVEEEEQWWYEGVPPTIRTECAKRQEEDKGKKEKIQYLYLIDYKNIASKNWTLLKTYFSMDKSGGKDAQLKWVNKLNDIRTITHHREKWPAKKDEVTFVREIYSKVKEKFQDVLK